LSDFNEFTIFMTDSLLKLWNAGKRGSPSGRSRPSQPRV
jgi:hypothetical protein